MTDINTIPSNFLLNESHWKQGYRVTEEGQLTYDSGIVGLFMRWVRWVWRAFVLRPDQFDQLVLNKFRELAQSLSQAEDPGRCRRKLSQIHPSDFPRFSNSFELYQAVLKANQIFEQNHDRLQEEDSEITPNIWLLIQNSFLHNLLVNIESQIMLNTQEFLDENIQTGGIEDLIGDPRNCFNQTEEIETLHGPFSVTSQLFQDFHRSSIFIDGIMSYGEHFPGKNIRNLIEEMVEKGFLIEEAENLLRFCSQVSTDQIAFMMAPYMQEFADDEPEAALQKKIEYHIATSEENKLIFHALAVKELKSRTATKSFVGVVTYQFQNNHFSSGDISTKLMRIPCNFRERP